MPQDLQLFQEHPYHAERGESERYRPVLGRLVFGHDKFGSWYGQGIPNDRGSLDDVTAVVPFRCIPFWIDALASGGGEAIGVRRYVGDGAVSYFFATHEIGSTDKTPERPDHNALRLPDRRDNAYYQPA